MLPSGKQPEPCQGLDAATNGGEPGRGSADEECVPQAVGMQAHPLDGGATWLQIATWDWLRPLMKLSLVRQLETADVWPLPKRDRSAVQLSQFREALAHLGGSAPVWRVLIRLHWKRWALAGMMYAFWCVSTGLQPFLIRGIVAFMKVGFGRHTCWLRC